METRQLMVWGLAVACLGLVDARFLRLDVPTYWNADAKPALQEDAAAAGGESRVRPATRKVGTDPKTPPRVFQQQSVKTDRLALRCGDSRVQVEVKQDLMGTGRPVRPEELTLGGCPPTEVDARARVLAFESELHECGSTLEVRDNALVYAFTLLYQPRKTDPTPIVRTRSAAIGVECRYLR